MDEACPRAGGIPDRSPDADKTPERESDRAAPRPPSGKTPASSTTPLGPIRLESRIRGRRCAVDRRTNARWEWTGSGSSDYGSEVHLLDERRARTRKPRWAIGHYICDRLVSARGPHRQCSSPSALKHGNGVAGLNYNNASASLAESHSERS
eukprot:13054022-Alexandrium_andersonii.AAC.1